MNKLTKQQDACGTAIKVTAYASSTEFLSVAGEWLERDEAVNNLMLGRSVSMASTPRCTGHGAAIGAVFTPLEHRGHGYASACVAALSQRQLDAGREFCCLYTDLANPTSNKIYQAIGYVPVTDSSYYQFAEKGNDAHE